MLKADFFYRALPWTELIHRDRRIINDLNLTYSGRLSVLLVYAMLMISIAAIWRPPLVLAAGGLALGLLALNTSVYRFFYRKRGLWFSLQTIPWHWFYYFYSGLAFAIGTARHFITTQAFGYPPWRTREPPAIRGRSHVPPRDSSQPNETASNLHCETQDGDSSP
jgi:hypothetical protein